MIHLYNYELSGNCYKLRLLMELLGVPYERIPVNFYPDKEHKKDWFLAINPVGQLPVLEDDGFVLRDAQACLVYLASRYDEARCWYPDDARTRGRVALWLAIAEDITRTASAARLHDAFQYPFDVAACRRAAQQIFSMMDDHLADSESRARTAWLAADHPTIADIACFPYVALAPEGGIYLDDYAALRRWVLRMKSIPGFVGMPGIFALKIDGPPQKTAVDHPSASFTPLTQRSIA